MIAVTILTSAVRRGSALVLLLLLTTSLFAAPPSMTAGALEATLAVPESVRSGPASLATLAEPPAAAVIETRFTMVVPEASRVAATVGTRTHQVLRL